MSADDSDERGSLRDGPGLRAAASPDDRKSEDLGYTPGTPRPASPVIPRPRSGCRALPRVSRGRPQGGGSRSRQRRRRFGMTAGSGASRAAVATPFDLSVCARAWRGRLYPRRSSACPTVNAFALTPSPDALPDQRPRTSLSHRAELTAADYTPPASTPDPSSHSPTHGRATRGPCTRRPACPASGS